MVPQVQLAPPVNRVLLQIQVQLVSQVLLDYQVLLVHPVQQPIQVPQARLDQQARRVVPQAPQDSEVQQDQKAQLVPPVLLVI